jgi:GNAT superfamily N-acetyltransferase
VEVRGEARRLRPAVIADQPALETLIAASARGLSARDYTSAQIEAALGTAWGVDSQLIRDGTYLTVEVGGQLAACGGWSYRNTLFGADAAAGREPSVLDPARDAARIRAFFVHPDWARRGLGTLLLDACESAVREHGFLAAELMATLPGERLYSVRGYVPLEPVRHPLPGGLTIDFIRMGKRLV